MKQGPRIIQFWPGTLVDQRLPDPRRAVKPLRSVPPGSVWKAQGAGLSSYLQVGPNRCVPNLSAAARFHFWTPHWPEFRWPRFTVRHRVFDREQDG